MKNITVTSHTSSFGQLLPEYAPVCMLSTLVFGLLAHGFALFTKFAIGDEAFLLFTVGATTTSGRWFLGLLGNAVFAAVCWYPGWDWSKSGAGFLSAESPPFSR